MKVAVITRHAISNYGSLLQTWATQEIVNKLGYDCEIVDYIRTDEDYVRYEKTVLEKKAGWNDNLVKRWLYLLLRQPESIVAGKMFAREQKKYLQLTKRYSSKEQLLSDTPNADIYMTGSDQVWGPVANGKYDDVYCLSFVSNKKKVAYAASFGRVDNNRNIMKYFANNLNSYNYITVRENTAVDIVHGLKLEAEQVLDPTLLISKQEWERLINTNINKDYILVYQLHNDQKLSEYAKKVAQEMGLPLYRVSASFHQVTRGGSFKYLPDIETFLSYIKNAKCIITDSFHGTAFAINLNVPFVEVLPNNSTGTRNQSILELTGLSHRILKDYNNTSLAREEINYEEVNRIIEQQRAKSLALLKDMLKI